MNTDDPSTPPDEDQSMPPDSSTPPSKNKWLKIWLTIIASKFLFISILVHVLFAAGAAVYVVQQYQARTRSFAGGPGAVNPSSRALEHKVSMAKKKNSMSAPAQAKRITVNNALSKVSLPEIITMASATTVVPNRMGGIGGNGMGLGVGGAGGSGGGTGGFGLPPIMNDRCSLASRLTAMRNSGGSPQCEDAILSGLRWLKTQQKDDGSFGEQFPVAMTGLALLSFMGHCERPTSKEFGPCVRKAIDYLLEVGGTSGKLAHGGGNEWAYEHGIATYALGEAYILTKEPKIAEVFQKAVGIIINGQGADGGWMYGLSKVVPSDTSVSGWQVQALKTAHLSGLNINGVDLSMKKSAENILRCRGPKGGFGYRGPEDRWSLTGVGVLVLQTVKHERGQVVRQALDFVIDEKTPKLNYDGGDANLYAWYYSTQACFQYGGSAWGKWNRQFQPEILGHQNSDGSWKEAKGAPGGGFSHEGTGTSMDAQIYRTSLCILMLEVYYRYLASSRV